MILRRVFRALKAIIVNRMLRTRFAERIFGGTAEPVPVRRELKLATRSLHEHIDLQGRVFTFLNERVTLISEREARRSQLAAMPLLWQFHYGYHDYLPALLESETAIFQDVDAFLEEWTRDYPPSHPSARPAAWHPFVLSLRI